VWLKEWKAKSEKFDPSQKTVSSGVFKQPQIPANEGLRGSIPEEQV